METAEELLSMDNNGENCPKRELLQKVVDGIGVDKKIARHISICELCQQWLDRASQGSDAQLFTSDEVDRAKAKQRTIRIVDPLWSQEELIAHYRSLSVPGIELGRHLGGGGMGAVFKAADLKESSRAVAVKFIRFDRESTDLRRRFKEERKLLASVEHSGIALSLIHI